MAYGQTKSVRGKADMPHPSGYKVTVADKSDTGSVMDTQRPVPALSPYFPINGAFKSPTTKR